MFDDIVVQEGGSVDELGDFGETTLGGEDQGIGGVVFCGGRGKWSEGLGILRGIGVREDCLGGD